MGDSVTDFLSAALYFIIALSILIAVHEFGHFWVARRCGVKTLRFSIGFGKPLWRRIGKDGTEYVVARIPLGGYVKMLDEREGEVAEEELGRAFNRKPLLQRTAIVLAGPVFNFLFAILAYWGSLVIGIEDFKPIVGSVLPESVAEQSGLQAGDKILAVDGEAVAIYRVLYEHLIDAVITEQTIELTVRRDGSEITVPMDFSGIDSDLNTGTIRQLIGIKEPIPDKAIIGGLVPGKPAEQVGLQPDDRIVAIDGQPMEYWRDFADYIGKHPGEPLSIEVLRGEQHLQYQVIPESVQTEQGVIGRIGAQNKPQPELYRDYIAEHQYPPLQAWGVAAEKCKADTLRTLRLLGAMLTARASLDNLSGAITIARYAKHSALMGWSEFLAFLGLISLSLGVINLLPIPLLDGGHLAYTS